MPDRDEVIKAIEACMDQNHPAYCNECYLDGPGFGIACRGKLMRDALAILREQEPQETRHMRHYSRPGVYADLWLHCEKCGYVTGIIARMHKYCPECGRKVKQ